MNARIAIATFATVLLAACNVNTSPGDGEKVGQVVKLSRQGMVCKTWEGELIRGGMNGGSGAFGTQTFDFTVEDPALAQKVETLMRNQTEVRITYVMEGVSGLCRSDSGGHFLTGIEPVRS